MKTNLLTRKQVKDYFKVSFNTLKNWEDKKILLPRRIGGLNYYLEDDVNALIK